jgi:hypothetical protein
MKIACPISIAAALCWLPSLQTVSLSADSPKSLVQRTREIVVSVVDGKGNPVAGANVGLVYYVEQRYAQPMHPDFEKPTGSDGRAILSAAADKSLQCVFAVKKGMGLDYVLFPRGDERPSIRGKPPVNAHGPVRLVLDGVHQMVLHVVDERHRPLAGIRVMARAIQRGDRGGPLPINLAETEVATDAAGNSRLDVVPANAVPPVVFQCATPDYFFHEWPNFDAAARSSEFTLLATRMPAVHVHVTYPDGKPAAGARIFTSSRGITYPTRGYAHYISCDAEGKATISSPFGDAYRTISVASGHFASPMAARALHARRGAEPLEVALRPGARVHGTLTFGQDFKPIPNERVTLVHVDEDNYSKLPEDQRWLSVQEPVTANVFRFENTDAQGRFEFFVAPGHYKLTATPLVMTTVLGPDLEQEVVDDFDRALEFRVKGGEPIEANLHRELPLRVEIEGRVVLKSAPIEGVPNANVESLPTDIEGQIFRETATDSHGNFHAAGVPSDLLIQAKTNDRKLGGIVRVAAADTRVVIPIEPTGGARGRFINEFDGKPAANRSFNYGIRVDYPGHGFRLAFETRGKADREGEFAMTGLVPGWKYEIYAERKSPNGRMIGLSPAGVVSTAGSQAVDLGDVKLSVPTPRTQASSPGAKSALSNKK